MPGYIAKGCWQLIGGFPSRDKKEGLEDVSSKYFWKSWECVFPTTGQECVPDLWTGHL